MRSKFDIVFEQVMDLIAESIASDIDALDIPQNCKDLLIGLKDENDMPDTKKQKAALHWIRKGYVDLPKDLVLMKNALLLIGTGIKNFQDIKEKKDLEDAVASSRNELQKIESREMMKAFNPDDVDEFNRYPVYDTNDGVKIYRLDDDKETQVAVRKAIDYNWGFSAQPWCLTARKTPRRTEEVMKMTEEEREELYSDRELAHAWDLWENCYNAYPKRIAFKDGKLLAFCANDGFEVAWWDRQDESTEEIPGCDAEDDEKFIDKYIAVMDKAIDESTSPEELDEIANHVDGGIRRYVARNPSTSVETLKRLSTDECADVRAEVVKNENTPMELVEKMASDKAPIVRRSILSNENVTLEILMKLADDWMDVVRQEVAANSRTPAQVLAKLAKDDDYNVRLWTARNDNASAEVLETLSHDEDSGIRGMVAQNWSTPNDVLKRMCNDEADFVAECAKRTLQYKENRQRE